MKWATCDGDPCRCYIMVGNNDKQTLDCTKCKYEMRSNLWVSPFLLSFSILFTVRLLCFTLSDPQVLLDEGRDVQIQEGPGHPHAGRKASGDRLRGQRRHLRPRVRERRQIQGQAVQRHRGVLVRQQRRRPSDWQGRQEPAVWQAGGDVVSVFILNSAEDSGVQMLKCSSDETFFFSFLFSSWVRLQLTHKPVTGTVDANKLKA